jgi:hypothetical protein
VVDDNLNSNSTSSVESETQKKNQLIFLIGNRRILSRKKTLTGYEILEVSDKEEINSNTEVLEVKPHRKRINLNDMSFILESLYQKTTE